MNYGGAGQGEYLWRWEDDEMDFGHVEIKVPVDPSIDVK